MNLSNILEGKAIEDLFIDSRNKSIWKKLSTEFQIGVVDTHQIYELKYLEGRRHVVILTDKNYNKGIFTHEFMHLNLRSLGVNTFSKYSVLKDLSDHFIVQTLTNLLNVIEHILFFDDFIRMGFKANQFVMDYDSPKYHDSHFKSIVLARNKLVKKMYSVYYLSIQMVMLSEEYYGLDRSTYLDRLRNMDHKALMSD